MRQTTKRQLILPILSIAKFVVVVVSLHTSRANAFLPTSTTASHLSISIGTSQCTNTQRRYASPSVSSVQTVDEATDLLAEWDRLTNKPDLEEDENSSLQSKQSSLAPAVQLLSESATHERNADATKGRCMLGICASSAAEGVATLKAWVNALQLPRGLLHGMDKDGVPLDLSGGVYIKYNSGGVYTFEDIRKSGMGFDALWKPGDALLEPYDGTYRGVYFQVELQDDVFRQYLVPLDIFEEEE